MTYQRLLLIVLFDSTRTIASSFFYELGSNKDERVFRVRLKTWIITDCMYTVHYRGGGGCHAPARPYAPVSKPGLLDEGRVPRGVQGRAGA